MSNRFFLSIIIIVCIIPGTSYAVNKKAIVAGLSDGYPPYQFKNQKQETTGFDADVLRLIFQQTGNELVFKQGVWDDIVASLIFTDKLDCIGGMEINEARKKYFDFTSPYYYRQIAIFILAENNNIKKLADLIGKIITGDRHSSLETLLAKKKIRDKIRIKGAKSKEESMRLLKNKNVIAMIAPKAVGFYLAKQLNVKVKILLEMEQKSPVGIAVKKGNPRLLDSIENTLQKLIKENKIGNLYQKWFR